MAECAVFKSMIQIDHNDKIFDADVINVAYIGLWLWQNKYNSLNIGPIVNQAQLIAECNNFFIINKIRKIVTIIYCYKGHI